MRDINIYALWTEEYFHMISSWRLFNSSWRLFINFKTKILVMLPNKRGLCDLTPACFSLSTAWPAALWGSSIERDTPVSTAPKDCWCFPLLPFLQTSVSSYPLFCCNVVSSGKHWRTLHFHLSYEHVHIFHSRITTLIAVKKKKKKKRVLSPCLSLPYCQFHILRGSRFWYINR